MSAAIEEAIAAAERAGLAETADQARAELARLTTAETEVERLLGDLDNQRLYVAEHQGYAQVVGQKLAQSEARVEALREALRAVIRDIDDEGFVKSDSDILARAALACPPQEGEK